MKTSKRKLIIEAAALNAIDASSWSHTDYMKARKQEIYFEPISYSAGAYGVTARLLRGHVTRSYYIVTSSNVTRYSFT